MKEVFIVGQGLAGTWLSWWLYQSNVPFKVIDKPDQDGASMRAAGLINPVTGRRMVTTWMIDELMPFAFGAYGEIGKFLDDSFIKEISLIDFFPSVQMLQAFQKCYEEDKSYLHREEDREKYSSWFQYDLGWGAIRPCAVVNVENLLTRWRAWLKKNGLLTESIFDISNLQVNDKGVEYGGMQY